MYPFWDQDYDVRPSPLLTIVSCANILSFLQLFRGVVHEMEGVIDNHRDADGQAPLAGPSTGLGQAHNSTSTGQEQNYEHYPDTSERPAQPRRPAGTPQGPSSNPGQATGGSNSQPTAPPLVPRAKIEPSEDLIESLVKAATPCVGYAIMMGLGLSPTDSEFATEVSAVMPSADVDWEVGKLRETVKTSCKEIIEMEQQGESE